MIAIRPEAAEDVAPIHQLNAQAFGRRAEADLVDALRQSGRLVLSLVAVEDGRVVGHVAFSRAHVQSQESTLEVVGLAPIAVAPAQQRQGIGSLLVRAGLERCQEMGHGVVFVLGEPSFYARFGFVAARTRGLRWNHPAGDEAGDAFMVAQLWPDALGGRGGAMSFAPEFDAV